MSKSQIIAVAGAAGVGKTTWIVQQLSEAGDTFRYFCPHTGGISGVAELRYES